MAYSVEVQNQGEYVVDVSRLKAAATAVLARHDVQSDAAVTVVIAADDLVQSLNRQYRDIDEPTDVLSFPTDAPAIDISDEPPYLGDLIIAYPYASAQAAREGHDLGDSLSLLVVHAMLHLLGYDHDTDENRASMWAAQEAALRDLGIPPHIVPALEVAPHDDPA